MRVTPFQDIATIGAALVLLVSSVEASHAHDSIARRHIHGHSLARRGDLGRRGGKCEFPTDAGLVAVTPNEKNAGWAMSPDQPCVPGSYCPYACPPGQLMAQWDPKATTYSYPASMNGGLYCNKDGKIEKPFPEKSYCVDGAGTVSCKNKAGKNIALCQTVLPGNEAMLIPTNVKTSAILAVPDQSYWASTSAHYYINGPGISAEEGCVWGSRDKPIGNWTPYVAGANQLDSGETFVTIGWNPIYIEPDVTFRNTVPNWGVRIDCDGNCNGLPCYIDPKEHKVNEVSQMKGPGAGGANFCVVTVPKGSTATITVFSKDGGSSTEIDVKSPSKGVDTYAAVKHSPDSSSSSSSSQQPSTTLTTPSSTPSSSSNPSFTSSSSSTSSSTSRTSSSSIVSTSSTSTWSASLSSVSSTTWYTEWSAVPTPSYPRQHLYDQYNTTTFAPVPTGTEAPIPSTDTNTTLQTSRPPIPQIANSGVSLGLSIATALICGITAMFVMAF